MLSIPALWPFSPGQSLAQAGPGLLTCSPLLFTELLLGLQDLVQMPPPPQRSFLTPWTES